MVYQQEIRVVQRARSRLSNEQRLRLAELIADPRNLVWMAHECHSAHHSRARPVPLRVLPDSVFEFAAEVLGQGAAFEYLRRRYAGRDRRLEALLEADAA